MWGRHCLEPLLAPNSDLIVPVCPPSKYLSSPLMSILNIARECGLQSSATNGDSDICAVCLERACNVASEGCAHQHCVKYALYLCSTSNVTSQMVGPPGSIPCPLCRNGIVSFIKLPSTPAKELKPNLGLSLCNPCILHPYAPPHHQQWPVSPRFLGIVWQQFLQSSCAHCLAVHSLLQPSLPALEMTTHAWLLNSKGKYESNPLVVHGPQQMSWRTRQRSRDLREQAARVFFGIGEAATESISAIQK